MRSIVQSRKKRDSKQLDLFSVREMTPVQVLPVCPECLEPTLLLTTWAGMTKARCNRGCAPELIAKRLGLTA